MHFPNSIRIWSKVIIFQLKIVNVWNNKKKKMLNLPYLYEKVLEGLSPFITAE